MSSRCAANFFSQRACALVSVRRSADVRQLAQRHLADLRRRIDELGQMAAALNTLIACCAGDDRPDCPILADLDAGGGR